VHGFRAARQTHFEGIGRERDERPCASAFSGMGDAHAGPRRDGLAGHQLGDNEQANEQGGDLSTHGIT
jgi:hypothetical protein